MPNAPSHAAPRPCALPHGLAAVTDPSVAGPAHFGGSSQTRVRIVSVSAGFEGTAGDVVGELAEVEGGAVEVPEVAVDRLCGVVAGAGAVEEHEDCGRRAVSVFGRGGASRLARPGRRL